MEALPPSDATFILCSPGFLCELFISPPLCGQLLMSPRLFKNLPSLRLRLAVLPHILPAPALSADSLLPSSSPVTLAVLSTLPVSDRPTDSFHCLLCLQVYPRRSVPAVDRLCVGVPAAEVSRAAAQSHQLPPELAHTTVLLMLSTTHTEQIASFPERQNQNNCT